MRESRPPLRRGYAYADAFRDIIGGLQVREKFDLDPGEAVTAVAEGRKAELPPSPPSQPDPLFEESEPVEFAAQSDAEIPLAEDETGACLHPRAAKGGPCPDCGSAL